MAAGLPPSPALDETIARGQAGLREDAQVVHGTLNLLKEAAGKTVAELAADAAFTGAFAPLASPALTGTPTAPTAAAGDDSTQLATTEFVQAELVAGSSAYTVADNLNRLVIWDTFDRPDAALGTTDSGHTWATTGGAVFSVESGTAKRTSGAGGTYAYIVSPTANVDVSVTIATFRTFAGIVFRANDDSNFLLVRHQSATELRLLKTVAGAEGGAMASATVPSIADGSSVVLRVVARGAHVQVFQDGVRLISHTLTGGDETTFASGVRVGVAMGVSAARMDNFGVYAADNSASVVVTGIPQTGGTDRASYVGALSTTVVESSRVVGDVYDRYQLRADGTVLTGPGTADPTVNYDGIDEWAVTSAVESMSRLDATSSAVGVGASGVLDLTYFRAKRALTSTQVSFMMGTTSAGATPTVSRIGLYTVATDGALTLVASTANDTALFTAAALSEVTKALSASYAFVAGQLYAAGILVVTAAALPTFVGSTNGPAAYRAPRLTGGVTGQTDLPASVASGASFNNSDRRHYLLFT